jgi:hypothetical protein
MPRVDLGKVVTGRRQTSGERPLPRERHPTDLEQSATEMHDHSGRRLGAQPCLENR